MKRLILALGIGAGALAISTPASAQTGCRWYDVNCRLATGDVRRTGGTVDSSWHIIGRDANGNEIYERRRVDGNGNVVIERARRDALGRMVIIDRDINNRNNRVLTSTRYDRNGMVCKYKENQNGYKEECKYVKNKAGKLYRVNDVYRDGVYRDGVYRDNVYRTNTVNGTKYKTAKASNKYNKAYEKQSKEYNKAVERQSKEYNKANKHNKH
jgi:hypothetical protein